MGLLNIEVVGGSSLHGEFGKVKRMSASHGKKGRSAFVVFQQHQGLSLENNRSLSLNKTGF